MEICVCRHWFILDLLVKQDRRKRKQIHLKVLADDKCEAANGALPVGVQLLSLASSDQVETATAALWIWITRCTVLYRRSSFACAGKWDLKTLVEEWPVLHANTHIPEHVRSILHMRLVCVKVSENSSVYLPLWHRSKAVKLWFCKRAPSTHLP